jgi:hypothetical protein
MEFFQLRSKDTITTFGNHLFPVTCWLLHYFSRARVKFSIEIICTNWERNVTQGNSDHIAINLN